MHDDAEVPGGNAGGSLVPARAYGIAAWLVAVVSIATMLSHGWVPLDEGTTLLAARWVEGGALPHRDFAYPYTGGLALLHAMAVRLGGDSMLVPRWTLLGAFALWLPAIWVLARRFATPLVAALVMLASAWWSVLVYPAAMPTWYLLFCATWAVAALARWNDTQELRWVVIAGVAAGAAVAFKQTGLATLVGAGFGVLAIHQREERRASAGRTTSRSVLTLALLAVAMLVPCAIVWRRGLLGGEALAIAIPLAVVIGALAAREWSGAGGGVVTARLLKAWAALALGALIPIVALAAWYAAEGALGALITANTAGVVRTATTIERAMTPWPTMVAYGVPTTVGIGVAAVAVSRLRSLVAVVSVVGLLIATVLLASSKFTAAYLGIWYGAQLLLPIAVIGIARRQSRNSDAIPLVIAAAAALLAINQVPYGAPNYFAYVAPLGVLAALAVTMSAPRRAVIAVLLTLTAFGGWFHRIGSVHSVGFGPVWWDTAHRLPGPHGRLLVTSADSVEYSRLVDLVAAHGGAEQFAAGPELGELYALAGTRRVVAQPYLLTDDPRADSTGIAAAVDTATVRAVVVNDAPNFLPPVNASAKRWIDARYPNVERVGRVEFRWR